jgi:hypothetical protein
VDNGCDHNNFMESRGERAADERLWTARDLAWFLGVSYRTALKEMADSRSPAFRVGKLHRILPDDARSFYGSRGRDTNRP